MSERLKTESDRFSVIKRTVAKIGVEAITNVLVSDVKISGQENLDKAGHMLEMGSPLFIMANHLSNLDGYLLYKILERRGFRGPVFILGMKLLLNPFTRFLVNRVRYILVWPPSLATRSKEEELKRRRVNLRAFRDSKMIVSKGLPIVIFPEGTRSRSGLFRDGLADVAGYIEPYNSAIVLPVGLIDTEKRLPVGASDLARLPGSVFKAKRGPVAINFGEPIEVLELKEKFGDLPKAARRKQMIGYVMQRIGELLPTRYLKNDRIAEN